MKYRVHWSGRAKAELDSIISYLMQFDPAAAARITAKLMACADSLQVFPRRGMPIGRGLRRITTVYPYVIRYRILDEWIEIVRVYHGARRVRARPLEWIPAPLAVAPMN